MLGFPVIEITDAQKCELEENMSAAYFSLKKAATELYGQSNIKRLRDEYKKMKNDKTGTNLLWCHPLARKRMEWMLANEDTIMAVFIRVAAKLCRAFHTWSSDRPGVTLTDYLQESAIAIYDAMYMYDGSDRFSTYMYWCVKNRLITFIRNEDRASGVSKEVQKLRAEAKKLMSSHHCDFDTALSLMQKTDDSITDVIISNVRKAMYGMNSFHEFTPVEHVKSLSVVDHSNDDQEEMRRAVEEADLTEMERRLVDAYLSGDKNFRTRISETEINPNTQTFWTKQRLSQIFGEACGKIKALYENRNVLASERQAA